MHLPWSRRRKAALPSLVQPMTWGSGMSYGSPSFSTNVREGWSKSEVVLACILKIAGAFPEAPLRVYGHGGEEISGAWFRRLLDAPNLLTSEFELWERTLVHYYLAGNAFWLKVRSSSGRIVMLWPLRPDLVTVVGHPTLLLSHYVLRLDGVDHDIAKEDIIHFREPSPVSDLIGYPRLSTAMRQVQMDNEATDLSADLMANRAMPGVVITTQSEDVSEEKSRRLREKFLSRFGADGDQRGGVAVLQRGMAIEALSLNLSELAFEALRSISETRICAVFEVPPILIGLKSGLDAGTYSNYRQAVQSFWEETIAPLHTRIAAKINADVDFGREGERYVRFDVSQVTALRDVREHQLVDGLRGYFGGLITLNEARALAGYEKMSDGDSLREAPFQGQVMPALREVAGDPGVRSFPAPADSFQSEVKRNGNRDDG